jgi:uncharacterized protein YraI
MSRLILFAAGLALLAATLPAQAASTARASAVLTLRSAPASSAAPVGRLAKNERVTLSQCTRHGRWCLAHPVDGSPSGWVLGSYLIGSAAKNAVTPMQFTEPFWLFR